MHHMRILWKNQKMTWLIDKKNNNLSPAQTKEVEEDFKKMQKHYEKKLEEQKNENFYLRVKKIHLQEKQKRIRRQI